MFAKSNNQVAYLNVDQVVMNPKKQPKGVFLDVPPITPANIQARDSYKNDKYIVYKAIRPMIMLLKLMGILPIEQTNRGVFRY